MPRPTHQDTDNFIMATRTWLSIGAALVLGAIVGFLEGRKLAKTQSSNRTEAASLPSVSTKIAPAETVGRDVVPHFDSADFESQLRKISSSPARKKWERMRDLTLTFATGDAIKALALAEKILSRQEFMSFRHYALEKWAEADPQAVLAYGQSLKNRSERQQAISAALGEWARQD